MGNPYPVHTCTVGPFDSYHSNVVNRLTRMFSNYEDCIFSNDTIGVTQISVSEVTISAGSAFKDDVFINIEDITIDFTDPDYYANHSAWDEVGYYYILLYYAYEKARPAPKPSIQILKPSERYSFVPGTDSAFLLLKVAEVQIVGSNLEIVSLLDKDPDDITKRRVYSKVYAGLEDDVPVFSFARDHGRLVVTKDPADKLYYGGETDWVQILVDADAQLADLREFVGSVSITDVDPNYTSTKVIVQGSPLVDSISALDLNATFRSGIVPPASPFAYQTYVDTSTLPGADPIVYIRNGANTTWIRWGYINRTTGVFVPDNAFSPGVNMVFYQDTAPPGWTILNTLDDKLLYVTKGSAAGGQTGGGVHSTGSWTISGLNVTVDSHTLTIAEMPAHNHTVPLMSQADALGASPYPVARVYGSTDTSTVGGGTGHSHTGSAGSSGTWRPSAYCAIICQKS